MFKGETFKAILKKDPETLSEQVEPKEPFISR